VSSHAHEYHQPPVASGSFFSQPRAVWAVAFACVIAFMGIGLSTRS
jgi:ACDE family multidrug resistance protein